MKTVSLIIIFALGITLHASAQKVVHVVPRTRVAVGVGLGYGYGYGYSPFYPWYSPWYAYPPGYYSSPRPTKLDLEIQDIQNDYKDRIWGARHDESLSRRERRHKVHELKHERDNEILQAKKDYYKRR